MRRLVYPDIQSLSSNFAEFAAKTLHDALDRKPQATLIIPGGNTPRHYLPALAQHPLPWERITITLSDERWVDTDDLQSNENLARQHLLAHLSTTVTFVGLKTRHTDPFAALDDIHQRLSHIPLPPNLTVLGLGEDGHIASLFPGLQPETATSRHCIATTPPIAPSLRVSLSLDLLASSEHIALVVTGENKRRLIDRLDEKPDTSLPIFWLVKLASPRITVFETNAA